MARPNRSEHAELCGTARRVEREAPSGQGGIPDERPHQEAVGEPTVTGHTTDRREDGLRQNDASRPCLRLVHGGVGIFLGSLVCVAGPSLWFYSNETGHATAVDRWLALLGVLCGLSLIACAILICQGRVGAKRKAGRRV